MKTFSAKYKLDKRKEHYLNGSWIEEIIICQLEAGLMK